MKIVLTGGGTGGHFYPLVAVAEAVRDISREKKLIDPSIYFIAPTPYNEKVLFDNNIVYKHVPAGKMRRYFSIKNFFDFFVMGYGMIKGIWTMFWIYPDVVFSKGGYGSFPVIIAARILGVPIIIHESDSTPGKANLWAAKYAKKIAVSYPEAANHFPKEKTAWTGNPIRKDLVFGVTEGAVEFLKLEAGIPTIFVTGGSQGSQLMNDVIMEALPKLLEKYQIIHQVGAKNEKVAKELREITLQDSQFKHRYKMFGYLDNLAMKMSSGASDLIITRAGSTIFEIANWHKPSIVIPITKSNGDHQRKNAYIYARTGAAVVIEEKNLHDEILIAEIENILENKAVQDSMATSAEAFAKPESAKTIANVVIDAALNH